MKKLIGLIIWLFLIMALSLMAVDIKIIKEPRPNQEESGYVPLKITGSVDEDLGDDLFLFYPKSFTADREGNVYVYDGLQAKVFKFDARMKLVKCFGSVGRGPGEFSGATKTRPVKLNIGADGNLYANDIMARKVLVFNTDGRHIRDLVYGKDRSVKRPVVDNAGNLYLYGVDEDYSLHFRTLEGKTLVSVGTIENSFAYLFHKPDLWENSPRHRYYLFATILEMVEMDLTADNRALIYYPTDSTLLVAEEGKIITRTKLWPRQALAFHKENLPRVLKAHKEASRNMFYNLFADSGTAGLFYLQLGRHPKTKRNLLYQFDLSGKVRKVFYVPYKHGEPYTLFRLKVSNGFLAVRNEKIIILTEETKK